MSADHRADHRHHPGAAVGVRAGGLHARASPGKLYQQFAMVVSVSMVISAINALTLSARAVRAGAEGAARAEARPDEVRDGRHRPRHERLFAHRQGAGPARDSGLVVLVAVLGGTGYLFVKTPTGFLPAEDQGLFFAELQLPEGASVNRTNTTAREVEGLIKDVKGVRSVVTVVGYSFLDGIAKSNSTFFIIELQPWEERTTKELSVFGVIDHIRAKTAPIPGANVLVFNMPPILGLGNGSGFEYQLQDLRGGPPAELAATMRGMMFAAAQRPELKAVFGLFSTNTPQIFLDIDREKAQILGVQLSDVFMAMQSLLGSYYINDLNLFGRTWQVNLQGEATDRDEARRPGQSSGGAHGDGAPVERQPAPGLWLRMDRHGAAGKAGRRPDRSSSSRSRCCSPTCSWSGFMKAGPSRSRCCLSVIGRPARRLGGAVAVRPRQQHLCPDRHRRADRAGGQERHPDRRVRQGRTRGGSPIVTPHIGRPRQRFRAVMMTSFAFILGLVPLVIAAGAGAASRARRRHGGVRRHAGRLLPSASS
jgi:multidrug efflux pump subunit AcrB